MNASLGSSTGRLTFEEGDYVVTGSHKRKYNDHLEDNGPAREPIVIKIPQFLAPDASLPFHPQLLVPRSCLPLAYLDFTHNNQSPFSTQLSSAEIEALESATSEQEPRVLIGQVDGRSSLYAVERVGSKLYTSCKLRNEIQLGSLKALLSTTAPAPKRRRQEQGTSADEWWKSASIPSSTATFDTDPSRKTHAAIPKNIRLQLKKPWFQVTSGSSGSEDLSHGHAQNNQEVALPREVEPLPPREVEEGLGLIWETVFNQYKEALYHSRASTAYFAKGPLPRARASSSADIQGLITSLRSSILSLALVDKKYKETIPNAIKDLPLAAVAEDEVEAVLISLRKKARKSKTWKIGKSGLAPGEEINIARWWLRAEVSDAETGASDARDQSMNRVIEEQRTRETQLQIVLMLEVLALEQAQSPHLKDQTNATNIPKTTTTTTTQRKSKKPQDLRTLVELSADRLCIWQSTRADEQRDCKKHGSSALGKQGDGAALGLPADNLRDFCTSVVLPFYGARVPDLSRMLCQKFGAPLPASPIRPSLPKAASSSHINAKPGAATQRQPMRKPRRTLERVLTDERTASRRPTPTLSRSATESSIPRLKREESDTSLSTIPLNKVVLDKMRRYNQREIDLQAVSQAAEARSKKKEKVDQELQGAIAALRKPNPRLAVKEFVEAAEKRTANSHQRKSKNPVRNPFTQGVQVMATPSVNRKRDAFAGLPRYAGQQSADLPSEPEEIPPSSIVRVPSSIRRRPSASSRPRSTPSKNHLMLGIEQTPSRRPSKIGGPAYLQPLPVSDVPSHSPHLDPNDHNRNRTDETLIPWPVVGGLLEKSEIQKTPVKRPFSALQSILGPQVEDTPMKARNVGQLLRSTEVGQEGFVQDIDPERSIYEALGWDDDVDELV